jgi:hypothetical protein
LKPKYWVLEDIEIDATTKAIIKYVYPKETLQEMEELFRRELDRHFPGARVEYLV